VLALEVLAVPAAALLAPPAVRLAATLAALAVVVLLTTVPVAGLPVTGWSLTAARWLVRRSRVRHAGRRAAAAPVGSVPPVAVPLPDVVSGALVGPRRSEIGVLWSPGGWTSALYLADDGLDAVERLLGLTASASGAVRLRSVLQQRSPAGGRTDPVAPDVLPLSAWLVVQVDPMPVVRAREAVGAVPALLRSEVRALFDHTRPGAVGLVALDHADLLDALAATAEHPRHTSRGPDADESWTTWRAAGRVHQAFAVRRDRLPPAAVVDLLLDGVTLRPGSTVTVAVRHDPGLRWPVVARVSHPDPAAAAEVGRQLRRALAAQGVRSRGLAGRQGVALLDTTLLAGTD
jgi:hypothetical protein